MRKEIQEKGTIIEIEEEVRIPDTDIILEKGDKIRVIEGEKGQDYDDEQGEVPGEQDTGPDEYDEKDKKKK